jgi:hypothetical protein
MASPIPAEFLNQAPTPVTISDTGAWKDIRTYENLVSDDATALKTGLPDQTDNDILIDSTNFWTGITDEEARNKNWNLEFSSERNAAYFGGIPSSDARQNNGWVGDANGCSCR